MKYDYNNLKDICYKKNIRINNIKYNSNLNKLSILTGKCCNCNNHFSKQYRNFIMSLNICGICSNRKRYNSMKLSLLKKYSVDNPWKIKNKSFVKKLNQKRIDTCIKKYGVDHPMKNKDVFDKNITHNFRTKDYLLGNKTIKIQGYENLALDLLVKQYGHENITNNKNEIPNIYYTDNVGIVRRHYVDIFIKHINLCIEVKSEFTFKINEENNLLKQKYARNNGFDYQIWIFDRHKNLRIIS